jgi:hypothetical protein
LTTTDDGRVNALDVPLPMPHAAYRSVNDDVYAFRAAVRKALSERGPITPYQSKRLQTACLAMREAIMCGWRRRETAKTGQLTHEQWCAYADRIVRFSEAADRALKDLGLDGSDLDSLDKVRRAWDQFGVVEAQSPSVACASPDGPPSQAAAVECPEAPVSNVG